MKAAPREIRLLAATGMLGTGFPEESLRNGLSMKPDVIGCDSGSTDGGPADLGTGRPHYSAQAYRRDLLLLLRAARSEDIPLIIGSAGGAGGDANLDWTRAILDDVTRELGLAFRLGVIYANQDKAYVHRMQAAGRIRPLVNAPPLDEAVIDRSTIVGMMGCEPIIHALEGGAQVVLAGRASDTAIYSAVPIMRGFPAGPSWHAGKILECGAAAVVQRLAPDCMFATISDDGFEVTAPNPALRCTPVSVAAHSLYENSNPFRMREPSGDLDLADCTYEQVDERTVRVTGSRFVPADVYTVKLEGVAEVGYQTIVVSGIRDPVILEHLDDFLATCATRIAQRVQYTLPTLGPDDWRLEFRIYGRDGVLGELEPNRTRIGHEVGVMIEVTAISQEIANVVAPIARHQMLHQPVEHWEGMVNNLALPYGTSLLERGAVYQFTINAAVEPASPLEMFRFEYEDVAPAGVGTRSEREADHAST